MTRFSAGLVAAACAFPASWSSAQEGTTVQSLLKEDFRIVSATSPANGGASLFLQKGDRLVFCFVSETRDSRAVTTQYCKPVQ